MKNFGLSRLRLVSPASWDPWRIEGIAHGTREIVESAQLFDDLSDALADCSWVVGMTARARRAKRSLGRPREIAPELLERAGGAAPVAVLLGREDRGLTNQALDRCHRLVIVPTSPVHPSLNLAQAALVMAYELWLASEGEAQPVKPPRRDAPPATAGEYEELFREAEDTLREIDFFKSQRTAASVMRTLREVGYRSGLDRREAALARAIAIEVKKYAGRLRKS